MIRKKLNVLVPEGAFKQDLIDLIAIWQDSKTIRTQEALWDFVSVEYPKFTKVVAHFEYRPTTKELFIREGLFTSYWNKYTF